MGVEQLLVSLFVHRSHPAVVLLDGIAADIMVIHKIGGSRDIECRNRSIRHTQLIGTNPHPAIGFHQDAALGLQSGLDAFMVDAIDDGCQFIYGCLNAVMRSYSRHFCLQRAREVQIERQRSFLACLQPNDDDAVSLRGEDRTFVPYSFIYIRSRSESTGKIQLATIVTHVGMAELQLYTAQGQKAHAVRSLEKELVQEGMSSFFVTLENQIAHFLKMLLCLRTVIIVRRTAPERFLIELDFLIVRTSIDHGTHVGIAYRQSFQPVSCRSLIPQAMFLALRPYGAK